MSRQPGILARDGSSPSCKILLMPDERDEFRPDDSPESRTGDATPPTGVPWGIILLFIGVVVVVVFAFQNTKQVPLQFLWWEGNFPLAIVILGTAGATFVLGQLTAMVYRRRRRRRLAEMEELGRLRTEKRSDD